MDKITIYGSSGKIRYPRDAPNPSEDHRERMRDRFFQKVFAEYDPADQSLYVFFRATSSAPEQFVGHYGGAGDADVFESCYDAVTDVVEHDFGWTISDPSGSPGQQAFESAGTVDAAPATRYDTDVIGDLVADEPVDFAAPDYRSAMALMKHLVAAYDGDRSVAVSGTGRSDLLADTDVVITTDEDVTEVRGRDGTHERYVASYTSAKADTVIDEMSEGQQAIQSEGHNDFAGRVATSFTRSPIDVGRFGYLARSKRELSDRLRSDARLIAPVAAAVAFLAAFWYADAVAAVGDWYATDVAGADVAVPLIDAGPVDSLPAVALLIAAAVSLVGWIAAGTVVVGRVGSGNGDPATDSGDTPDRLPDEHERAIATVIDDVRQSPFADPDDLMDDLARKVADTSADVVFRRSSANRVRRLGLAGAATAFGAAVGGLSGWLVGAYLVAGLLDAWLSLVTAVLVVTGVTAGGAAGVLLRDPLASLVRSLPAKAWGGLAVAAALSADGYLVWYLYNTYGQTVAAAVAVVSVLVVGGVSYVLYSRTGGDQRGAGGTSDPYDSAGSGSSESESRQQPSPPQETKVVDDPGTPDRAGGGRDVADGPRANSREGQDASGGRQPQQGRQPTQGDRSQQGGSGNDPASRDASGSQRDAQRGGTADSRSYSDSDVSVHSSMDNEYNNRQRSVSGGLVQWLAKYWMYVVALILSCVLLLAVGWTQGYLPPA